MLKDKKAAPGIVKKLCRQVNVSSLELRYDQRGNWRVHMDWHEFTVAALVEKVNVFAARVHGWRNFASVKQWWGQTDFQKRTVCY